MPHNVIRLIYENRYVNDSLQIVSMDMKIDLFGETLKYTELRHLCLGQLGPRYSDIYTVVSSEVHVGWEAPITVHLDENTPSRSLYISSIY